MWRSRPVAVGRTLQKEQEIRREVETKGASSATTMTANKQPLSAATNRQKLKTVGILLHARDAAKAAPSSHIATNLVCPRWDAYTERKCGVKQKLGVLEWQIRAASTKSYNIYIYLLMLSNIVKDLMKL